MDTRNIEDIYPLSPMQQGMLFHSLYAPETGVYFEQSSYTLRGDLNIPAFERAWQRVIDRHPVLRTAFVWEGLDEPLQVVHRRVELPLEKQDWRGLSEDEQETRLEAFLQADRERGFDLGKAPLIRLTLIRTADDVYHFVWSHHHLLLDGWSQPILVREVFALYEAFQRGQDISLPPVRPYRDYIAWLQRQDIAEAEAFWRRTLKGFTAPTPLTVDVLSRPHEPVGDEEDYAMQRMLLPAGTRTALEALARQHQLTLNTLVQGAWAILLSRYSGEDDVVFGATVSGRPADLPGAESMVGLFINTLPVRVQVRPEASVLSWLKDLLAHQVEMRQYEYSPLVEIQGWSEVPRDLPLFESILVFENYPVDEAVREQTGSLQIEWGRTFTRTNYPLTVAVSPGQQMGLLMAYDTRRFDAAAIRRMMGHMQALLTGMAADPQRRIATLPLLTEEEREQILVEWNATAAEFPRDQCIHHLVEAQVAERPDAIAVTFEDQALTYAELNRRANQLAHYLQKLGVGPEVLVGISTERSLEMIIGILGTLKAGGAYLPLDPTYPQERLAYMLEDSHASVLLTQSHLLDRLGVKRDPQSAIGNRQFTICLDTDWEVIAQEPDTNPVSGVTPDNLAYVIYTSGSTGRPTMLRHRGLCNLTDAQRRAFGIRPGSRILQFSPFSFDASVWETFMALRNGATLCLARQETLASAQDLVQLLREQRITNATLPPTMLRVLPVEDLPAFETIISAGEACTAELVERWSPGRDFFNAYGPTETTVCASMHLCADQEPEGPPIGRPIANTRLYILDRNLQPVPVGVPGELCIGGVSVGRGYLNRPELTAERFIPDPFSGEPGARLYRTGDLVKYLPDGNIEFLGRIDHQVKVRGFRIELGEIEAALKEHPALREAVVLAREDTPGDKRLVAYVVPEKEPSPSVSELRSFLEGKLTPYMIPSAFVFLDAMPLTPSGKVDRKALPAPDQARPDLESDFVAPRTPKEQILAEIWSQVLGVAQVGIYDNFFELGGDSILSIQVIARANQAGLRLTPRQIFEHPTVAGLAAVADTGRAIQAEQGIVEGPVPLTPIQRWFFAQDLPNPHHWNQDILLEVRQPLDPVLLAAAVEHLLEHHDALRLRFERISESASQRGDGWRQVNAGMDGDVPFICVDLSGLPETEQGPAIEAHATALQSSLNLESGPLLRVAYFDLGAERPGRLLMVVHHLAIDGVSWRILLEDFQAAYQQLSQGKAVRLPPKTTSYQYWAQRLAEYARSEAVREELDYWLAVTRDGMAPLPVDYPGGDNTEASARSVTVSLTVEETQALLQEVPAAYRTEINDALLTALAQTLARWTGSRTVLIDLEGHGREDIFDDVDLSRTVGWFTALFPVRLNLEGADGPGEALKAVKEQLRRVPNRGLGYGLLRYLNGDEEITRQLEALPQPEVIFNYLGQLDQAVPEGSPFGPAPESSGPAHSPQGRRTHVLEVNGVIAGGRLQLEWTYSENLHRRDTIERLAQDYVEALRSLIAHCQSTEVIGYTPSDFAEFGWDEEDLEGIMAEISKAVG